MKRYKKTYAIHTLAEKHTTFHLGKTRVRVSFTGGQVTKNGVTPATFTTEDPVVQLAIERSKAFEAGAVTLLAKYPMSGEVKIGRNDPSGEAELAAPTSFATEGATPGKAGSDEIRDDAGFSGEAALMTDGIAEGEPTGEEIADGSAGSEPEVVEVSCRDVAKQYLEEHFGEKPSKLRTIADVQECAAKYGITFSFV